jgi:DNA-binding NarL/FixJ family response regulator
MTAGPRRRSLYAMNTITVLVVDDHPLFAEALGARLSREPDLAVLTPATGSRQARATLAVNPVDVVLLDVVLGDESGLDLLDEIRDRHPAARAVMLTATGTVDAAVTAVRRGALAWVPKTTSPEELVAVIRGVLRGEAHIPPELLGGVLRELSGAVPGGPLAGMTAREREILQCLVDGLSRTEIAGRLYLSVNTVRTHTQNLFGKLGVHSVLEAVAVAMHAGMRPHDC